MRRILLWTVLPAAATVAGVVGWFALIPGRSGAG
jgi:hypothetical protein